jgi:hypothetical protein
VTATGSPFGALGAPNDRVPMQLVATGSVSATTKPILELGSVRVDTGAVKRTAKVVVGWPVAGVTAIPRAGARPDVVELAAGAFDPPQLASEIASTVSIPARTRAADAVRAIRDRVYLPAIAFPGRVSQLRERA